MSLGAKKLVSVSATSTQVTETRGEAVKTAETAGEGRDGEESEKEYPNLTQVPCIRYSITFQKKFVPVSALFDLDNEINVIHLTFARELRLSIRTTDVRAQKIDGTMLDTFGMVVAAFSVTDKANRVRFFEKTFLMANVSPKVVLGMLFLSLSDADIDFLGQELWWKTYTIEEAFPIIRHIELVSKKEFVAATLDPESDTFVIHVASLSSDTSPSFSPLDVYPSHRP